MSGPSDIAIFVMSQLGAVAVIRTRPTGLLDKTRLIKNNGMTKPRHQSAAKPQSIVRSLSAAAGFTGPQAVLWILTAKVAAAVTIAEVVLAVTIVLTALFGPEKISHRAFQMISWLRH
jgi:hypothetical protein